MTPREKKLEEMKAMARRKGRAAVGAVEKGLKRKPKTARELVDHHTKKAFDEMDSILKLDK